MNSEKVKEIKNWLSEGEVYRNENAYNTLDLINELESENERLRLERDVLIGKKIVEKQKHDKAIIMKIDIQEQLKDRIAELENIGLNENITVAEYLQEMQRLKDKIAELEKENEKLKQTNTNILKSCNEYKNRHLKLFAERLKDRLRYTSPTSDVLELSNLEFDGIEVEQCIDKTLKELINETT